MPSIAPLVAAWKNRARNLPAPARGSGEASNGQPVTVEMLVAGAWVDITSYCLVRDDSGQIRITYGITGGEGSQTDRAQGSLELANQDGRFSPRNPSGPYFGLIGRNTPMRISVPDGLGGKSYRIWGEATEWAPNWDPTGTDVWSDVTLSGIMQRLAQAPAPEHSVIYRAITDPPLTGLVAYWPCEDPTGATQLNSALTNGSAMSWTGNPVLAAFEGFGASDPLPTLTDASLTGGITKYDTTSVTSYQMRFLLAVPKAGFSNLDVISRLQVAPVATGASLLNYFDINYNDPPGGLGSFGGPGTLTVQTYDSDESPLQAASITMDVRGRLLRVSLENSISGTTLTSTLRVLDINTGVTDSASLTHTSTSMSRVLSIGLAPDTLAGSAGVVSMAAGHLLLQTVITDIGDLGRAIQPSGEAAGRRIQRLCGEEGIAFDWVGDLDDTVALGPQGRSNLLALAQEATLADGGLLYETRNVLGLGYRPRASLYNQDPALVLNYAGFNLAAVPVPVEDDRYIQNTLTVTVNSISATYTETSGNLGTNAIGTYGETSGLTLNLADSETTTLLDEAAWRVHLGTVDEARFPQISVNLAHPSITPDMRRAILALRLGDRVQVTNPPSWLPPDTIDQLVIGAEETITHFEHRLTLTCQPASPYSSIGVLDTAGTHLDTDGSQLLAAAGTGDTTIDVVPAPGLSALWTTDSSDTPFDIKVGGEVMRVTAVASKITDTFTRTTANGWGTADSGQAWTSTGGVLANHLTQGSEAQHSVTAVNTSYYNTITSVSADVDLRADFATDALATGGSQYVGLVARWLDTSNIYYARLSFTTTQTVQVTLQKRVGGAQSDLQTVTVPDLVHAPATYFTLRFQVTGTTLRARAWPQGGVEPNIWHVSTTDSSLVLPGSVGVRSILDSANTNPTPVTFSTDNFALLNPQTFTVTRSINGVVKAQAAGADVRLANPTILAL